MVWKQDLSKLKQRLKAEEPTPPTPPPKPKPVPVEALSMEDQDELFLKAMGHRPKPSAAKPVLTSPRIPEPAVPVKAEDVDFGQALRDIGNIKRFKGLKPMERNPILKARPQAPAPAEAAVEKPSEIQVEEAAPEVVVSAPLSNAHGPQRIQLAAGMTVEVDGVLDLRGHSLGDARDRLKDRLADGVVLGWRALHVILGADPELHQGILALLAEGGAPMVQRYAQAPIPMGGRDAWILYLC